MRLALQDQVVELGLFIHFRHTVGDRAVMHRAQIHGRHVLQVRIEDHVAGYAVVLPNVAQRILNAGAVEARLADGVQQHIHRVISQRGKLLRLLLEAVFETAVEADPARVLAGGIVGEDRLKTLGRIASLGQQRGPQRAISPEDALLHPAALHLLEDFGRLNLVGPQHNRIGTRGANHI